MKEVETKQTAVLKIDAGKIEIDLPFYCKNTINYFKVFSGKDCLMVTPKGTVSKPSVQITDATMPFNGSISFPTVISEAEFESAVERTLNDLTVQASLKIAGKEVANV